MFFKNFLAYFSITNGQVDSSTIGHEPLSKIAMHLCSEKSTNIGCVHILGKLPVSYIPELTCKLLDMKYTLSYYLYYLRVIVLIKNYYIYQEKINNVNPCLT